jgi:hypothetical protein
MMLILTRILSLGVGSAITGIADWSATSDVCNVGREWVERAEIVAQMSD